MPQLPPPRLLAGLLLAPLFATLCTTDLRAIPTEPLDDIPISTGTGEKPQSKAWYHAGTWWVTDAFREHPVGRALGEGSDDDGSP